MTESQQSEFKKVKQRLSAQQKVLKSALDEGRLPTEKDVTEFETISMAMQKLGEPKWRGAMTRYMNQLGKLKKTIASGNPAAARYEFQELLNCKITCHKEFR
jgi:XXXCH domain-containing protein